MHIHIEVERPLATFTTLLVLGGGLYWLATDPRIAPVRASLVEAATPSGAEPEVIVKAEGGDDTSTSEKAVKIENDMKEARSMQALMNHREELMRYQVQVLQQEREALGPNVSAEIEDQFRMSVEQLTDLLMDQKKAEDFLLASFRELWEAEGRADFLANTDGTQVTSINLLWPVQPLLGISAYFHDEAYKARFGLVHNALDIPVPQGSPVAAAADGVVKDVVDNGMGFNYITIQHEGGAVTLYGHLSAFTVQPGDTVYAGQQIGFSGGRPGTPGAGFSTGPHLHFGLRLQGIASDPLPNLPYAPQVEKASAESSPEDLQ